MKTEMFCIWFLICGCEPVSEFWVHRGNVLDQNTRTGIDSVDVYLSVHQLSGKSNVYTDNNGFFTRLLYSSTVKDFNGLRELDFHFIFSKSGFATLDTIIPGHAFRYGTEGNYEDTLYLDSIFLQATP